nr:matrix metalloproteinase-2-like [Ipomoea batatas]
MMPQPRRKKWTEVEEKTLIDKYGEMVCDGTLAKMKTREKKYKPIALHVNSVHNLSDPIAFPWQWTWKDVSTKVQNMRHQYALVKQKIKKEGDGGVEEFDWMEGLTHWSNFLRYKEVFGDVVLVYNGGGESMAVVGDRNENSGGFDGSGHGIELVQFGHLSHSGDGDFGGGGIDAVENGAIGLGFDYDGEEGEENYNGSNNKSNNPMKEDGDDGFVYEDIEPTGFDTRKKRKVLKGLEKKAWGFLASQLAQLRDMETRFEQREVERERERQRREHLRMEMEQERERKWEEKERERQERERAIEKLRRQRLQEWEAMEKESEERERRRREEELIFEREREERTNRRRSDSKKRIDEMINHHRAEMTQIQTRILHEQQNITSQLLGILSQWTGHPTTLSDHTGASSHYLSQMMQNLHHENTMVHGDARVEGDNQEDHFIVDG